MCNVDYISTLLGFLPHTAVRGGIFCSTTCNKPGLSTPKRKSATLVDWDSPWAEIAIANRHGFYRRDAGLAISLD